VTPITRGPDDELAALDVMLRYSDQRIGFADCVSFVLMRRNHIRRAFSFDRHFELAGFNLWSGPA
jgi:predicted nucleic acid-binding protein